MSKKCLIAGIPESGKSTYIAALWYSVTSYSDCSLIASDNLPENTDYLDKLKSSWLSLEKIRTSKDVTDKIEFNLKAKDTEDEFTVIVPDFKGETFFHVLEGESDSGLQQWLKDTDSVILMMKDFEFVKFNIIEEEQATEETDENNTESQDILKNFRISSTSGVAKNLLLLKYLKANMDIKKLIVCVTAWDQTKSEESSLDYVKRSSPGLYQYIEHSFESVEFYGLSAQGGAYPEDNNADSKNYLLDKTRKEERAYVMEGNKRVYDVTLPLKKAIL